jgi:hypothetical protein
VTDLSRLSGDEPGSKELDRCKAVAVATVYEQTGFTAAQRLAAPSIDGPEHGAVPVGER